MGAAFRDTRKWWIYHSAAGPWVVLPPEPNRGQWWHEYTTGREALAAFAEGEAPL